MKRLIIICAVAILFFGTNDALSIWIESGDAGDLPGTAQIVSGIGPLTEITGTISSSSDADMFQIYVSNPVVFSAYAIGGDPQLFLFDAIGMGIYANDDVGGGSLSAFLPAGDASSPTSVGVYYLAISEYNNDPTSAGGLIFPSSPFTGVFGPTGPGGGSPISGWTGTGSSTGYDIALIGAEYVPEPATICLLGLGILGLVRRKKGNVN